MFPFYVIQLQIYLIQDTTYIHVDIIIVINTNYMTQNFKDAKCVYTQLHFNWSDYWTYLKD
jgi:hypothetical protein